MSHEELKALIAAEQKKLDHWSDMDLTLDLTRGKPNQAQLDLSSGMLNIISDRGDCFSASGLDCRNYGILDGLPVRNGSTIARARQSAEYVSFLINKLDLVFAAFIFTPQLKEKRYRSPPRKNRHLHDIISRKYCK